MRARVAEDQGSVEAVNQAVYATCAALIWHQGLGGEALAVVEGRVKMPSKVTCCTGRVCSCFFVVLHVFFTTVSFFFIDTSRHSPDATLVL